MDSLNPALIRSVCLAAALGLVPALWITAEPGPASREALRQALADASAGAGEILAAAVQAENVNPVDLLVPVSGELRAADQSVGPAAALLANLPAGQLEGGRMRLERMLLLDPGDDPMAQAARAALVRIGGDAAERFDAVAERGGVEPLLRGLGFVEAGEAFDGIYSRLRAWAPGGARSFEAPLAVQGLAAGLLARSPAHRAEAFAALGRVAGSSGDESLREAALAGMRSVPGAEWPAGYERFQEGHVELDPAVMALGQEVYMRPGLCSTCHQPNGQGMPGAFPPLVNSPWMGGDPDRMIKAVAQGLMGEIEINGQQFNNVMPPQSLLLNDAELAAAMTYVRNSWGNKASPITEEQVKTVREAHKDKVGMWTVQELLEAHPLEEAK